jgi:DNA replication protein DnaC
MKAMAGEAVCPKCGGAGWIVTERGGVSGAERCECFAEGRAEKLEDRAQIPPLYRSVSFDTFVLPGPDNPMARRELQTSLLAASNFVREFPNQSRPGLLFIGEPGSGKTHLAVSVLRKILEKGHQGLFCDYQGLLDQIRSGYDASSNSANKEAYRTADGLGGGHHHRHHYPSLQSSQTADCHHQPARSAGGRGRHAEDRVGDRVSHHTRRPHRRARAVASV